MLESPLSVLLTMICCVNLQLHDIQLTQAKPMLYITTQEGQ